jgi:hypothetical protein
VDSCLDWFCTYPVVSFFFFWPFGIRLAFGEDLDRLCVLGVCCRCPLQLGIGMDGLEDNDSNR